ncbi:MAG: histidinol dehydrogenase [Actinomycetota bacterium]|nr:histidinol dehydrogenase [Actinomycetota bacterium]
MIMKIFKSEDYADLEELRSAIGWVFWSEKGPLEEVRKIINEVEQQGDEALYELAMRFDGIDLRKKGFAVSALDLEGSSRKVSGDFAAAARAAIRSVTSFHRSQSWESQFRDSEEGARIGQMVRPLRRVGIYVPGGGAAYPSTAMMTAIPAKVAGVSEIAVCVPPGSGGEIATQTLFALHELGIEEVYRLGGAQAVAAMALGTETIPPVDKVVGPGNIYVTLAKKEVFGRVGIDMLAGPTELVILADKGADADYLAYDMLAQLEHGSGSRVCLITEDPDIVRKVDDKIAAVDAENSVPGIRDAVAVLVEDLEKGARLVDVMAPEHLLITCEDITGVLSCIHNAGAIFLGGDSPVSIGDYAVGVNHVLPTAGAARYSSPLGVYDFIKRSNVVFSNYKANRALCKIVETLAEVEGLLNHAESMRRRLR